MTTTTGVPAANASSAGVGGVTASTGSAFDSSGFLKILLAEMRNQDPTQPTDPTQWATQYAQMTGVQQSVLTNQKLDSLLTSQALSQASSVVGRSVQSADGSVFGKIVEVRLTGNLLQAKLDNGKSVDLTDGVTLS
jgi:flagellar basal-body rod modification protein FlgD